MRQRRSQLRFISSTGAQLVSGSRGILCGLLVSGSGNVSLSIWDGATTDNLDLADRKAVVRGKAGETAHLPPVPTDHLSGLVVSGGGTGYSAALAYAEIR